MLQEIIDLQNRAVSELVRKVRGQNKEITFRAPTGSGKTRMMADFMNRILSEHHDIIFIVSTLSRGELPKQNYDIFVSCANEYPKLKPYLINTELSGEEDLYIPDEYNVYVLPRELYREKGILKRGAFDNFLRRMTDAPNGIWGSGLGKRIYLIKDECHNATNNLDEKSKYFERVFNFSATPNLERGQRPDVLITDEEAVAAKLIKDIDKEFKEDDSYTVEDALDKLLEIRDERNYYGKLGVRPCLIIQISNASKANEEMERKILPALNNRQSLKWMSIVSTYKRNGDEDTSLFKKFDTNDDVKTKLPPSKWKEYARKSDSTIDVIIFKMVITEGWDIPRACMLYQVRDTQSKQLDEQVMGRVRRNPCLTNFEELDDDAKDLATTAWIWGVKPQNMKNTVAVRLWKEGNVDVREQMQIRTTKLEGLTEKKEFDTKNFMDEQTVELHTDIFTLYKKLKKGEDNLIKECYKYAGDKVQLWWKFMEKFDVLKRKYDNYICDYAESVVEDKITSLPLNSTYMSNNNHLHINDWLWLHKDQSGKRYDFDSDAEREWANLISEHADDFVGTVTKVTNEEEIYLWGKNYPYMSEVHYEYYLDGRRKSYPDFVMKDKKGNIHLFEVKSLKGDTNTALDIEEYKIKIEELKKCYKECSRKLSRHYFYIPILNTDDSWKIFRYANGVEKIIEGKRELTRELKRLQE